LQAGQDCRQHAGDPNNDHNGLVIGRAHRTENTGPDGHGKHRHDHADYTPLELIKSRRAAMGTMSDAKAIQSLLEQRARLHESGRRDKDSNTMEYST
jgi:hypothetical protein